MEEKPQQLSAATCTCFKPWPVCDPGKIRSLTPCAEASPNLFPCRSTGLPRHYFDVFLGRQIGKTLSRGARRAGGSGLGGSAGCHQPPPGTPQVARRDRSPRSRLSVGIRGTQVKPRIPNPQNRPGTAVRAASGARSASRCGAAPVAGCGLRQPDAERLRRRLLASRNEILASPWGRPQIRPQGGGTGLAALPAMRAAAGRGAAGLELPNPWCGFCPFR